MFKDRIVWITGASSGIGRALARQFHAEGARLVLSGRREAELAAVADACGGRANAPVLPFEATDFDKLPAIVERGWNAFGRIDVLVNNAGVSQRSLASDTDLDVYRRLIEIDLLAPIALSQALLPRMVASGGGRFIVISSVAGKVGVPMRTGYSAAKHGLFGYFDALRAENAAAGIHVHMVCPGSVKTDVSRNALAGDGQRRGESDAAIEAGMPADEAARWTLAAIKKGKREFVVARGQERLIVLLRRLFPDLAFDRIAAAVAKGYAARMRTGSTSASSAAADER